MGWTGLDLSADQEEDVNVLLRSAWRVAYGDAFANYRCAVFREHLEGGKSRVYFSPWATELGAAFGAAPCRRPDDEGELRLVAGEERAWYACFNRSAFDTTLALPLAC
jgi:hypothetical protein